MSFCNNYLRLEWVTNLLPRFHYKNLQTTIKTQTWSHSSSKSSLHRTCNCKHNKPRYTRWWRLLPSVREWKLDWHFLWLDGVSLVVFSKVVSIDGLLLLSCYMRTSHCRGVCLSVMSARELHLQISKKVRLLNILYVMVTKGWLRTSEGKIQRLLTASSLLILSVSPPFVFYYNFLIHWHKQKHESLFIYRPLVCRSSCSPKERVRGSAIIHQYKICLLSLSF